MAATTTRIPPEGTQPKPRRRTTLPIGIAIAIVLLAEIAVRVGAHHLPSPQIWSAPEAQIKDAKINSLAKAHQTGGVVFLSTSVLDVGIDPAAFIADSGTKLPVYNAALSGANLPEVQWWEDHIVLPKLRPKVVVVALSSRDVNLNDPQGAGIAQQFFASDPVRKIDGSESIWQRLERYGDDVSYLFRYRKDFRQPETILHHNDPISAQKLFTSPLGQELGLSHQRFISGANVKAYFQSTLLANWQMTEARLSVALAGIIHDALATGAQVLLVDAPVTQYYIDLHPNGATDYDQYERALAAEVATIHVPFVPSQVWATSFFADPIHLDGAGAQRFTAELATRLRSQVTGGAA